MTWPIAPCAILLTLLLGCRAGGEAPLPLGEDPLATLDLPSLDGTQVDRAALAGKVVVVNFWSPG